MSGGGGGACCFAWLGFGDAAEGDFVAQGAELADELADLAVVVALAFVVVGAEVVVAAAGVRQPALTWSMRVSMDSSRAQIGGWRTARLPARL
jgi:hypothetical protein